MIIKNALHEILCFMRVVISDLFVIIEGDSLNGGFGQQCDLLIASIKSYVPKFSIVVVVVKALSYLC